MCLQLCRFRDNMTRNLTGYSQKKQQNLSMISEGPPSSFDSVANFQNLQWDLCKYLVKVKNKS